MRGRFAAISMALVVNATAVLFAVPPAAAQNVTLKLTTLDRENEITSQPLIWWMKTIGERTNKRAKSSRTGARRW